MRIFPNINDIDAEILIGCGDSLTPFDRKTRGITSVESGNVGAPLRFYTMYSDILMASTLIVRDAGVREHCELMTVEASHNLFLPIQLPSLPEGRILGRANSRHPDSFQAYEESKFYCEEEPTPGKRIVLKMHEEFSAGDEIYQYLPIGTRLVIPPASGVDQGPPM